MSSSGEDRVMRPGVSVVIAAYNAEEFIGETLASVLGQTYAPVEIIVVDDGSTDDTAAVVRSFGSRVRLIQQANMRLSTARNTGLAACSREYISIIDADDLWAPDKLSSQVSVATASPGSIILTGVQRFTGNASDRRWLSATLPPAQGRDYLKTLLHLSSTEMVVFNTALVPTALARAFGGWTPGLHTAEDWDFWLRCAKHNVTFINVDRPLHLYRKHAKSLTATAKPEVALVGARAILASVAPRVGSALLVRYLEAATAYLSMGDRGSAIAMLASAARCPSAWRSRRWYELIRECVGL